MCKSIFFFFRVSPILVALVCQGYGQVVPLADVPKDREKVDDDVDGFKKFDLEKLQNVAKAFLNSGTVTERAKYVRDPKRVVPLMKKFYGGEKFKAEGFEKLNKTEISYRGNLMSMGVRTSDFTETSMAIERVSGKTDGYLIDWESWVGFCDMTVDEMKKSRPIKPVTVRVIVRPDSYFNYGFEDDGKWNSYKLEFRGGDDSFAGYAKNDSDIGEQLALIMKFGEETPLILQVVYPSKSQSGKQVEIVGVVCQGWVDPIPAADRKGK